MSDLINEKIDQIKSDLKFPLKTEKWDNHWESMVFDPLSKTHTIYLPTKSVDNNGEDTLMERIGFFHELIHAKFSEQIHPIFGGCFIESDSDELSEEVTLIAYRYACDWFIWGDTIKLLPTEGRIQLKDSFDRIIDNVDIDELPDFEETLLLAFILAVGQLWIEEDINELVCKYHPLDDENLNMRDLVECFLNIAPEKPSVESLIELINSCLSIAYDIKVKLIDEKIPILITYE